MEPQEAKKGPSKVTSPLDRETPSLEGWLWKLGENRQAWKKRWFALIRNRLYYMERKGAPPINFIYLDPQTVAEWQAEKCASKGARECSFKLQLPYTHRIYYISAESRTSAENWMQAIHEESSNGEIYHVDLSRDVVSSKTAVFTVLDVLLHPVSFDSSAFPNGTALTKKARYLVQLGTMEAKTSAYHFDPKNSHFPLNADCTFPSPAGDLHITVQDEKKATLASAVIIESDWKSATVPMSKEFSFEAGKMKLELHFTTSAATSALLFSKGLPMTALPLRVDAGDILLFSSNHILSYGAKLFTMSEWDHVGLIVRWFNQSLRIFEATGDGVGLYDLNARVREVMADTKLAVRRLQHDRDEALLDRLYAFIRATKGRPFKKNLLELAKAAGAMQNKEDMSSLFCSQLCAGAYQAMGLLNPSKPSNQYLPRDWGIRDTTETMPRCPKVEWDLEPKIVFRRAKAAPKPRLESVGRSPLRSPRGGSPAAAEASRPPPSPRQPTGSNGNGSDISQPPKENTHPDQKLPPLSPRSGNSSGALSLSMPLLPTAAPPPANPPTPSEAILTSEPVTAGHQHLSRSHPATPVAWSGPVRKLEGIRLGASRMGGEDSNGKPVTLAQKVSREEKKQIRRLSRQSTQPPPPELDVMRLLDQKASASTAIDAAAVSASDD